MTPREAYTKRRDTGHIFALSKSWYRSRGRMERIQQPLKENHIRWLDCAQLVTF